MLSNTNQSIIQWGRRLVFCMSIAVSTFAHAQQAPISIEEAVTMALSHNASMAQTRAAASGKQEDLLAAQLWARPIVGFTLNVQRGQGESTSFNAVNGQEANDDDPAPTPATTLKPVQGNYGVGTLALSAPVFQNGVFFFQESPLEGAASGTLLKAQSDVHTQAAELSNQVAQAYINALSAAEQQSLQQIALEKLQSRLEIVQKRVRAGASPPADELSAKAALAEKISDLNAARRLNALQLMQLSLALGRDQKAQIAILPIPVAFPNAPKIDDSLNAVMETHPSLRSQQADLNVAKAALESQYAESMPKVTFDVSRTEAGNFYYIGSSIFYSAGFKMTLPLLDFGQSKAKERSKGYAVEQAEQKVLQARATLVQSAFQTYYAYQDAVDKFEAGKAALAKAEFQESISTAKRVKRLISLDTLFQDEALALAARVSQVKLRYETWIAWANYIKSLGRPYSSTLVAASL